MEGISGSNFLCFEGRVIPGNPLLDSHRKFLCFLQNPRGLGLCSDKSIIVVNHVPFPSASVEVIAIWIRTSSKRELDYLERNPVMTSADDPVGVDGS